MTKNIIKDCIAKSSNRFDLWVNLINFTKVQSMAEIGVLKGDYASHILKQCHQINNYYMIDPWRSLEDWNKPANTSNEQFEEYLLETKEKTSFAQEKRIILRGKTTEVIEEIPDSGIDCAYIDGDHTLRGITVDLIRLYPKIRVGGWIGGDDFINNIWQHSEEYEPTLVFPFSVYFAEAIGAKIYALPYNQFFMDKNKNESFSFIDLTGKYKDIYLKTQLKDSQPNPPYHNLQNKIKKLTKKLISNTK